MRKPTPARRRPADRQASRPEWAVSRRAMRVTGGLGDTSFWQVADLPDVSTVDLGPYAFCPTPAASAGTATNPQ